jgi:flavin-dependent dehydrogenase
LHLDGRLGSSVSILGGGPAGASAAIAARLNGSPVQIVEKSRFPRHKVCGEFLSPEIAKELDGLGLWDAFAAAGPARIRRMQLHFARRSKTCSLPEPAWGLSRYAFDAMLLDRAVELGAELDSRVMLDSDLDLRARGIAPPVIALGRSADSRKAPGHPEKTGRGGRLFGFKTHFTGPVDDAVELFFFNGCYVGVNVVESGRTNVCGLGPENHLKECAFDYDRVVRESPALAARLAPLTRDMKWISTGPLVYGQKFEPDGRSYLAGDALSFVDPFTGSGLLAAVKTGAMAGTAASRNDPVDSYLRECRASLKKPFEVAGIFRKAVESGWGEVLAGLIPGRILFALTRPGR